MKSIAFFKVISFLLVFSSQVLYAQTLTENIRINQVGFFAEGLKKAVAIDFTETEFEIWTSDNTQKVFSGMLTKRHGWDASGETNVQIADFTHFKHQGSYVIVIGDKKSYPFIISNTALDTIAKAQMKYYYFNRSGYALDAQYARKWARAAGHLHTAVTVLDEPTRTVSMPGGWYDAGDYGLYMETASMAACQIMMSYEQFTEYWDKTEWNIPESGNGVPDILDEVKYALKWMYKMKDTDNGVWYKVTSKNFPGSLMPADEKSAFYCMVKNATSAYDYAATFAFASRLFKKYETQYPGFSDSCFTAAKEAWDWAVAHEVSHPACYNPTGVVTGEYKDNVADNGNDNKVLAGVEMYITTGETAYLNLVEQVAINGFVNDEANWYEKRPVACMQLALHGNVDAKNAVIAYANSQLEYQNNHAYHINLGKTPYDFNWGSNRRIANRGMALMAAYVLTKDVKYLHGVTNSMDYILGRNATGYSFITGFGSKQAMHPHHRISDADKIADPQPGLPIQGSYYGNLGQCTPNTVSPFAAKNYIDNYCSYATSELSVDQASPSIFNLGGLNTFLQKTLQVEITEPAYNTIFSVGSDITVVAETQSQANSITHVNFYANGVFVETDATAPYTCTITNVAESEIELSAIAYNADLDSSIAYVSLIVGNAKPRVTIVSPKNNALVGPNTAVEVETSVTDLDGTITKVECNILNTNTNLSMVQTKTSAPYNFTIPQLQEGDYTITIVAYDNTLATTTQSIALQAHCNNLVANGDFSVDAQSWKFLKTGTANANVSVENSALIGNNALHVEVLAKGAVTTDFAVQQLVPIKKGNTYYVSYMAKSDIPCAIEFAMQHESDAWDIWVKHVQGIDSLQTYPKLFAHTFTATADDDSCKIKFLFGLTAAANVYIDNVTVTLCKNELENYSSLEFRESQATITHITKKYSPIFDIENSDGLVVQSNPRPLIIWESSDETIATVSPLGVLTPLANGATTITAKLSENQLIQDYITIIVEGFVIQSAEDIALRAIVSPTQVKNTLTVDCKEIISHIEIIAMNGQLISQNMVNNTTYSLNVQDVPAGQYIVKIYSASNKTASVIIEKL